MSGDEKTTTELSNPVPQHDEEKGPIDASPAHALTAPETLGAKAESNHESNETPPNTGIWHTIVDALLWMPRWCRYDETNPPKFGLPLNILFAFAGTFTVANLYYAQPIEDTLARHFHVSHEQASLVPTCSQAGYAAGLIFVCPLGDLVRRRPFVILLMILTPTLWLGLCVTNSFNAFLVLSCLTSITTVTPLHTHTREEQQIMLPLVGDLAPPARRATALSVVTSGIILGLLIARLLAGIISTYSSWRNIYWMSLGVQYLLCILLWLFMPDYPPTNTDITYLSILTTIVKLWLTTPVLVQATLMGFFLSATFTSFWTTLTFLLSGSPYHFNTVTIGLFSLAGMTPMFLGPIFSRYVIDKVVTQVALLMSLAVLLTGICIGTFTGKVTVAGPVLQAALQDFGLQMSQIANRTAIYAVAPKARNRVNTAYMIGVFCGQLMGTAVGNKVYNEYGWVISGCVSIAFVGVALFLTLLRGPAETGWVGWHGGFQVRKTG
ncbi:hypothetical protein N7470_004660 [Penicillium chermesinum]|nr:hypothetical protein N7470_004660 [Penicillium chermesinum]